MAAKDFDYENFANDLAGQAVGLVPQEFNEEQKQYVVNTLGNFSLMAGKTLAEDPNLNFDADTSKTITQIIAEWSFHKSVDVIRSGIPRQYWDGVLQKIAYTIFEISKQAFTQKLPSEQILDLVEHHVKRAYLEAIKELKDHGAIDEGLMEFASSQSNMEKMAQEMQNQQQAAQNPEPLPQPEQNNSNSSAQDLQLMEFPKVDSKVLKLATVALLFKRMNQDKVQTILNTFDDDDAKTIIKYMKVPALAEKVGPQNALRCLQEIKTTLPKNTDLTPAKVVLSIKKITEKLNAKQIDTILIKERTGVKRLVYNAIEGNYYDKMPPKIASIVATHLRDSV
ncbi:hypothetical protein IJ579_02375 [bacterium]|nr:hypothetical protein [bacterium]